jgi:hypothetical protein
MRPLETPMRNALYCLYTSSDGRPGDDILGLKSLLWLEDWMSDWIRRSYRTHCGGLWMLGAGITIRPASTDGLKALNWVWLSNVVAYYLDHWFYHRRSVGI